MCKCVTTIAPASTPVCNKPREGYPLCAYCNSNRETANPGRYHTNWFDPVFDPGGICESIWFNGKLTIKEACKLIGLGEDCDG